MVHGAIGMGFSTAIKQFLLNGMTYPQPDNPKPGDTFFDHMNNMWRVFNGLTWVEVNLQEHKCNLDEESIQE
tara:strand:- start:168 stop:383 length:216 start_codon:yes stop_codon:yes gene_type:complete